MMNPTPKLVENRLPNLFLFGTNPSHNELLIMQNSICELFRMH